MVHLRQLTTGLTVVLGLVTLLNVAHCAAAPGGREGGERVQEGQEFTLTSDHVRLLRHLRVVWSMVEAGGPVIDIERPFGSTQIQRDVNRILGHRGGWLQISPAVGSPAGGYRAGGSWRSRRMVGVRCSISRLAWSALTMVIAAVPGLLHQYRADLGSMLSAKDLRERDRLNGMVLFVCGILIYMLGSLNLTLTMIGATAVFVVRDLRPDLIRGLIRKSDMQTGKGRRS